MRKESLRKYAKAAIRIGLNVQKDQDVIIYSSLNCLDFTIMCVEEAYKAKARKVSVEYSSDEIIKLKSKYENIETLSEFDNIMKAKYEYQVDKLPCLLHIISEDPEGLVGADQDKLTLSRMNKYKYIKEYRDMLDEKQQWCIIAVPNLKWAKKCFPNLSDKKAIEALWKNILHTARINDDPIKAWNEHNKNIADKCEILNNLDIDYLHYTNSIGTDFKVGLIKNAIFMGGAEELRRLKIKYNPNMPTEECFTTPNKYLANGKVVSSLPLSVNGQLIKDFTLEFKDGKVVNASAKENEAELKRLLDSDEGASYLGEVALVPFSSPINQTNVLYYNTLFDENAVCHLALGRGFSNTIKDFTNYTLDEIRAFGVNESRIHVDFMIGTKDLNIVAYTRKGEKVEIFKDGEWAI